MANDVVVAVVEEQPTPDPRIQAKKSIAQIFGILKITKVVYVDDLFEDSSSKINALVGLLEAAVALKGEECRDLFPHVSFGAGVEAWDPEVREWWEAASDEDRERLLKDITGLAGYDTATLDYAAFRTLQDIIPEGVPIVEVAPSTWEENEKEIQGATAQARVLCLVDREFTYSAGRLPHGVRDGVDLLLQLGTKQEYTEVMFGLFSHTFTVGEEIVHWRQIAEARGLQTDQFLPFSKRRQSDVVEFAVGLEMVTLNMLCDRLKRAAAQSMLRAQENAAAELNRLNVYEFEKMVLDSSWIEGTWEPDTLFRIYQVFHRDAARADISQDAVAGRVNQDVLLAREVSKCRIRAPHPAQVQRWGVRHLELYETDQVLNGFHSPLRTGDLFKGPRNRYYILLAQPCDLMVRTDSGARKSRYVSLVRVEPMSRADLAKERLKALSEKGYDFLAGRGVLPYFTKGKDDIGLVRFSEGYSVTTDLLDLAVLDVKGRCRIAIEDEYVLPPQLSVGWRSRAHELRLQFVERGRRLNENETALAPLSKEDRASILRDLMPTFAPEEMKLPKLPYAKGIFEFNLRRIAHFREPGATRLLGAYMRHLSRDAEEHDFGK